MFKPKPLHLFVPPAAPSASGLVRRLKETQPFFGLIEAVVVESPAEFPFDGAIERGHVAAIWTWVVRDLAPTIPDTGATTDDVLLAEIVGHIRKAEAASAIDPEARRRLSVQLGGEEVRHRVPLVLNALKCRGAFARARDFGRAVDAMSGDAAVVAALEAMPVKEPALAALLMHAAMAEVHNPAKLVTAVVHIAGGTSDISVMRSGYGHVIEAILSQAQNQIPALRQQGTFVDADLICSAVDRFHRLIRSITALVELSGRSRWLATAGGLTRRVSELLEPRLAALPGDIGQAMRRRDPDRLESDQILAALNGCYILKSARDCRDSLALNSVIDQTWTQVGNALEVHVDRNLSLLRENPANQVIAARLDAAIKMAELRFGSEYADIIRKARDSAERGPAAADTLRRSG